MISFVTPAIIYHMGIKKALVTGWAVHCLYVMCNFYPSWVTLIPGSILLGFTSSPMWTSLDTYISALARKSVELQVQQDVKKVSNLHVAFSNLNGVFMSLVMASHLTGNLISSTILFQSSYNHSYSLECGTGYCPQSKKTQLIDTPQRSIIYILLAVFLISDVIGLAITVIFLPDLQQPRFIGREVKRKLKSYWLSFRSLKMWLIIPVIASPSMTFSLHISLFTEVSTVNKEKCVLLYL